MIIKAFRIIYDFYKSIKKGEFVEVVIIPFIICFLVYIRFDRDLNTEVLTDFNTSILTLSSLLVAFGICCVTLLFSTSNNSINDAKTTSTKRKISSGYNISYFQLIQLRVYYTVILVIVLIMLSIINTVFLIGITLNQIFYISLFLIIHTLATLLMSIISMYHLTWKDR